MGDPETEVVLPRLKTDLVEIFMAMSHKTPCRYSLDVDPRPATTVMLVSGGYPEAYEKGKEINGLDTVTEALIFHAGAKWERAKMYIWREGVGRDLFRRHL
jgi:phosphoribosylamine--glycine ligase